MDEDEASPPAEHPSPEYAVRLVLARCPELTRADLIDLSPEVARLMTEAIDALADRLDELSARLEAREAA
jgi:hypothetical protein